MESALRERLVLTTNTLLLAGGIALAGAGCTSPEMPRPAPTVTYDAPEGSEALPKVDVKSFTEPSSGQYINSSNLAYGVLDKKSFTQHDNPNPDKSGDYALPYGRSAPVLDIMIGKDGELRYKSHNVSGNEESLLLGAVGATGLPLKRALREGQVGQLHFRVFEPNQYPGEPDLEPRGEVFYIHKDYNDGGKPAIYYYFPARGFEDTEAVAFGLSHEASHALLGQHEVITPDPEHQKAFVEACTVMKNSALAHVKQDGFLITSSLDGLKRMSPKVYRPAFDAVKNAIREGTYAQLDAYDPNNEGNMPACYLQNPWLALTQQIREKNLNGGNPGALFDQERFEPEINELVEDWHDLLKESKIYNALSESSYLARHGDNNQFGHPYENLFELTASSVNLGLLQAPGEFGGHVSDLPDELHGAVMTVMEQNVAKLKTLHNEDAEFIRFIDQQYANFLAKAKR